MLKDRTFHNALVFLLLALLTGGCRESAPAQKRPEGVLRVVSTTGLVGDLVRQIGGGLVQVEALMGAGVDPHLYKATHGDLQLLREADVIFHNGLHLEGKMSEVLTKMSEKHRVFAVTAGIDRSRLISPPEFSGSYDPHVWFDASLWQVAAEYTAGKLSELLPGHAAAISANASAYIAQLEALHRWAAEEIATIPRERRVLVTAHDAFGYFGRAYDIEVRGLQGISTAAEFGLHDVRTLVELTVERGIKAVFLESSVPERFMQALLDGAAARGHSLIVGGVLYSDALGEPGTAEGEFVGMFRYNVKTITSALR